MVDRARTTIIKWLMRNYSSWAWIHLFFVEFVVPSVVHFPPFSSTEKTISVWIWERLSQWLPYSQIVCRVSWFWRSQNLTSADLVFPSVAPVVLHFVLHCGKGVAQLGLEGLRRKVSLADYGNSSSGRELHVQTKHRGGLSQFLVHRRTPKSCVCGSLIRNWYHQSMLIICLAAVCVWQFLKATSSPVLILQHQFTINTQDRLFYCYHRLWSNFIANRNNPAQSCIC